MPFKVAARTILQLGAELISSDGVAFYELIKNAFDAGSPDVDIRVVIRIASDTCREHLRILGGERERSLNKNESDQAIDRWRLILLKAIDSSSPGADELRKLFEAAESLSAMYDALEQANYIDIDDTGTGMSAEDLQSVYLTVGTPHRKRQKDAQRSRASEVPESVGYERPVLGEKGIGRLAAMGLGLRLRVRTSESGEHRWNVLRINWNDFAQDLDAQLKDIPVTPRFGRVKEDVNDRGTCIRISALTSDWTKDRLRKIANDDISKMGDPFADSRFPVQLSFNNEAITVPKLDRMLFEHAQARCEAAFYVHGTRSCFKGTIHYTLRNKERAFAVEGEALLSVTNASSFDALSAVGPFAVTFYWFNRQTLRKLEGVGNLQEVIRLQERWAGGLMVYRDGFRVNPYGSGDDDWLTLDPIALGSPAGQSHVPLSYLIGTFRYS